jgi:hypothetical protein
MAILLTALHVAPLPREFIGFQPERKNLFDFAAPDRQWLALTQYASESSLQTLYGPRFDAPRFERIPGDPQTMQAWSSFPIRYAHRRDLLASGGLTTTTGSAPPGNAPPPTQAPQGGGTPSGF